MLPRTDSKQRLSPSNITEGKENWTINPAQTEDKSTKFNENKPKNQDGEEAVSLPVVVPCQSEEVLGGERSFTSVRFLSYIKELQLKIIWFIFKTTPFH